MGDLVCSECGARQVWDPHADPRCLHCGGPARESARCYGCHGEAALRGRCPRCRLPVLPEELYPAALMLRYHGVDLLSIPDRVKALSAAERADFGRRYRESWARVDEAFDELALLLDVRLAPAMRRLVVEAVDRVRAGGSTSPETVLSVLRSMISQYGAIPPAGPPFAPAACKAIHEAAPWKLSELGRRVRFGRPGRGLDDALRAGVVEHAKALESGFGEGGARFACGVAFLNAFTFFHAFVPGEAHNRNIARPVFEMADSAARQRSRLPGVPVSLVRGHGIVWAVGKEPSGAILEPWAPDGYVFVPDGGGPTLRLHEPAGLRAFLGRVRLPVEPRTLGALVHWLMAPFPWGARVAFEGEDLATPWAGREAELEDRAMRGGGVEGELGVPEPAAESRNELTIRIDGAKVVYRPPEVEGLP